MSKSKPQTPRALAKAILDELEREYMPPYGDDEEWLVQQMIEQFLKQRKARP